MTSPMQPPPWAHAARLSVHPPSRPSDSALRRRYVEYCQGQASALLGLLPKDAIRPLYRKAREWATARGLHENKDPMATLVRYCRELLPLPPFEPWLDDYELHRTAYLQLAAEGPLHARTVEPVMVDVREVTLDGRTWTAGLSLFRDGAVWRGFIGFRQTAADPGVRTAAIFCEEDPKEIRERFTNLAFHTVQAFLRSALP